MAADLEFYLLGGMEIRLAQAGLSELRSSKARALLAYLAGTRESHSRSILATLLWGDMPEANARMNLSQALTTLRRHLADFLNIERHNIGFRLDRNIWVDVTAFEAAVMGASRAADMRALRNATDLYRGDFLEGFHVHNAPEFDHWAMGQRARLREMAQKALWLLCIHFSRKGEQGREKALEYTFRILALEPWQEGAHQMRMRLLALSGRRTAALKQFDECQRILREELNVDPSQRTMRLLERIRRDGQDPHQDLEELGDFGLASEPPIPGMMVANSGTLPSMGTSLIGRREELTNLLDCLTDPDVHLVTISGMGGIGKTRLATAFAHQMEVDGTFPDGVFYIPLSSIRAPDRLPQVICQHLGIPQYGSQPPEALILDHLRDKACLLVLDNFEQLLPQGHLLSQLARSAPNVKLLVTSRERLRLREEWIIDLRGLPYPDTIQAAKEAEYDAINLFSERARQIRPSFRTAREISGLVRICRLTQGLPLALEHAASMIRIRSAEEIASQIEVRLDTLSSSLRNIPDRHRSMRAVFDESWHSLSEHEQMVLPRLSVFRGGFTLEAAAQVAGLSADTLASLSDKSWVRRAFHRDRNPRFDLHELVRQYTRERLLETGPIQTESTHAAHLAYFLSLAEDAKQYWDTKQERDWLEIIEADRENMHAALQWATDHDKTEQALRLNSALVTFWIYNSPSGEASDRLEASLAVPWQASSSSTTRARAEALVVAGHAALQISDDGLAERRFQEGYDLFAQLGDPRGRAWALRGRGFVCLIRGDLEEAKKHVWESHAICMESHLTWGLAWSLHELGNISLAEARLTSAESLLKEAMELFQSEDREMGMFRTLISLGHLRVAQGQLECAAAFYRRAMTIRHQTRYMQFVAQILEGMGHIALAASSLNLAVQLFGAAQARRDSIETKRWAHHEAAFQAAIAQSKKRLQNQVWQNAWGRGYRMKKEDVLDLALSGKLFPQPSSHPQDRS